MVKQVKKISIIVAAIILCVISAVIGIHFATISQAENSAQEVKQELKIEYCNLSFKDNVYIKYAVKAGDKKVKILIWNEQNKEYTINTNTDEITDYYIDVIGGKQYFIFDYTKLSAKQMTDDVYARAYYEENGESYYGDVNKYSILRYAYNKLGKTGTATTDKKLRGMLNDMLAYGASAQEHFGYKADKLATDEWYEVKLSSGVFEDGSSRGLYTTGTKLKATAPAADSEGAIFTRWIDENDNIAGREQELNITVSDSNKTYTPVYVKYSNGLEFKSNGNGTSSVVGIGSCTDTKIVIPRLSQDGDIVTTIGVSAFENKTFTSVEIPATIIKIETNAFLNCGLKEVYYDGTKFEWSQIDIATGNDVLNSAAKYFTGKTYTVTFVDYDGTGLDTVEGILNGATVTAPKVSAREGYCFVGWDKSLEKISSDMTVMALYESVDPIDIYNYTVSNNIAKITGYKGVNTKVYIPDTIEGYPVQEISSGAFKNNTKIAEVFFPASLTVIGDNAFNGCISLKKIALNEGLLTINKYAFANTALSEVTIPDSVTTINSSNGASPFNGCTKLNCVVFGDGMTYVPSYMFSNLTALDEVVFGANITTINDHAFYNCSSLKEVNLPSKLQNINASAFENCSAIKTIECPSSLKTIGGYVFKNCTSLTEINFSSALQEIGSYAFEKCSLLKAIECPSSLKTIGEYAFGGCASLEKIILNEGLSTINKRAFANTAISEIVIPDSVTTINSAKDGYNPFNGCTKLRRVVVGNGMTNIPSYMFNNATTLEEVVFGANITTINDHAFYNCSALKEVNLPSKLQSINKIAFEKCSSLKEVECPSSLKTIEEGVFYECTSLAKIVLNEGLLTINKNAFAYTAISELAIPDSVTTINSGNAYNPFNGCAKLRRVVVGNGMTNIPSYMLSNVTALEEVVLGANITTINDHAFYNCSSLKEVNLPSKLQNINANAFENCSAIKTIECLSSLKTLGEYAFGECTSLEKIILNEGLSTINKRAFAKTAISEIVIPDSVTTINSGNYNSDGLFNGCTKLRRVVLGDGLTYLPIYLCYNLTTLEEVVFGDNITAIDNYAFYNCSSLTKIDLPSKLQNIWHYVFSNCSSLVEVNFSPALQYIGNNAFEKCSLLKAIECPSSLKTIGEYAFGGCASLEKIILNEGLLTIKKLAFNDTGLKEVAIPDSVVTIESYREVLGGGIFQLEYYKSPFLNCKQLHKVVLGKGINEVAEALFYNLPALDEVVISDYVSVINAYAFYGCTSLKAVNMPSELQVIKNRAFSGCVSLSNITWGDEVTSVGNYSFANCKSLKSVDLPLNLETIGSYAFSGTGLKEIKIPAAVKEIGEGAFSGCGDIKYAIIEKGELKTIGAKVFDSSPNIDRSYYCGSLTDWAEISINTTNSAPLDTLPYIYSETMPTYEGDFWYYSENGYPLIWDVSLDSYMVQEMARAYNGAIGSSLMSCSTQYYDMMNNDMDFMNKIYVYELAAIIGGDVADNPDNKITKEQMYLVVLMDILGYQNAGVTETSEMERAILTYSTFAGVYLSRLSKITDIEKINAETMKELMPSLDFISDAWGLIADFIDITVDYVSARNDLLGFALQCQGSIDILKGIRDNKSNASELRSAAGKCVEIITSAFDGTLQELIDKDFKVVYLHDLANIALNKIWGIALAAFPGDCFQLVAKGVKITLDVIYKTGVSADAYYQLGVTQGVEVALRKQLASLKKDYLRSENKTDAVQAFSTIELYKSAILKGYDYTMAYLREMNKSNIAIYNKKEKLQRSFAQIEKEIENSYNALYC